VADVKHRTDSTGHSVLIARALRSVFFWKIIKTAPTVAFFDIFQLLVDFRLSVATSLDNVPETDEFIERDLSIVVDVDSVEKFASRDLTEGGLPMVHSLVLVNRMASIDVKYSEHILHVLQSLWCQLRLQKNDRKVS